jgi:hypothetical protein
MLVDDWIACSGASRIAGALDRVCPFDWGASIEAPHFFRTAAFKRFAGRSGAT